MSFWGVSWFRFAFGFYPGRRSPCTARSRYTVSGRPRRPIKASGVRASIPYRWRSDRFPLVDLVRGGVSAGNHKRTLPAGPPAPLPVVFPPCREPLRVFSSLSTHSRGAVSHKDLPLQPRRSPDSPPPPPPRSTYRVLPGRPLLSDDKRRRPGSTLPLPTMPKATVRSVQLGYETGKQTDRCRLIKERGLIGALKLATAARPYTNVQLNKTGTEKGAGDYQIPTKI